MFKLVCLGVCCYLLGQLFLPDVGVIDVVSSCAATRKAHVRKEDKTRRQWESGWDFLVEDYAKVRFGQVVICVYH